MRPTTCARLLALVLALAPGMASAKNWSTTAQKDADARAEQAKADPTMPGGGPQSLQSMQALRAPPSGKDLDDSEFAGLQIRRDALREAALSYGARGGLAFRTFEIQQGLDSHAGALNRAFDFRGLLIAAPSGLLIEPPIISEQVNALIIADKGQTAAVADRIYNISREARIVAAGRDWRTYLSRDWSEVPLPPALLLPKSDEESELWAGWVQEGWQAGIEQADAIFQSDLNRLTEDFTGMVRYRRLLSQGIVSAPYTLSESRGITGGGDEMRVGDRQVTITGPSQLNALGQGWTPKPQR